MVVVKQGDLPPPGKQYKVYLNEDRFKHKWYLRVTHTFPTNNQHFRAGTYNTREEALKALETLDPVYPKKGRSRKGTVDQYANGQWRVRIKHRGEHMHVGYFKNKGEAEQRLKEALADTNYLDERYFNLLAKRQRKREISLRPHEAHQYRTTGYKRKYEPPMPMLMNNQYGLKNGAVKQEMSFTESRIKQMAQKPYVDHGSHLSGALRDAWNGCVHHRIQTETQNREQMAKMWFDMQNRLFGKSQNQTADVIMTTPMKTEKTATIPDLEEEDRLEWCGDPFLTPEPAPPHLKSENQKNSSVMFVRTNNHISPPINYSL